MKLHARKEGKVIMVLADRGSGLVLCVGRIAEVQVGDSTGGNFSAVGSLLTAYIAWENL